MTKRSERRSWVLMLSLVVFVLAVALVVFRVLFPDDRPRQAVVVALEGEVQIIVPGGGAKTAEVGAKVDPGSQINVADQGRTVLGFQGDATLTVDSDTSFRITEMTNQRAEFHVERGRVETNFPARDGRQLAFTADRTEARATTEGGQFSIAADGAGTLAAASEGGTMEVAVGDEVKTIDAGQQVVVTDDHISDVMEIPSSILLKVAWPEVKGGKTRDAEVEVTGHAPPGTLLEVAGARTIVDRKGEWKATVKLKEGKNRIRVKARDVAGHEEDVIGDDIERDTRGPPIRVGKGVWQ